MPTYERFLLAAELLGMSPQELASRLSSSAPAGEEPLPGAQSSDSVEELPLHSKYLGRRVDAVYEPSTGHVRVTSGPLAGQGFSSASKAAIAVVESVNPERESSNTNGRLFWIVTTTGQPLRSVLGRR
jgi:hypothetical protein